MSEYRFLTTWCLGAGIDPVWEAIYDSKRWPEWWRGVERVVELARIVPHRGRFGQTHREDVLGIVRRIRRIAMAPPRVDLVDV